MKLMDAARQETLSGQLEELRKKEEAVGGGVAGKPGEDADFAA
jgi:hypothetical protein